MCVCVYIYIYIYSFLMTSPDYCKYNQFCTKGSKHNVVSKRRSRRGWRKTYWKNIYYSKVCMVMIFSSDIWRRLLKKMEYRITFGYIISVCIFFFRSNAYRMDRCCSFVDISKLASIVWLYTNAQIWLVRKSRPIAEVELKLKVDAFIDLHDWLEIMID